MTNPTRIHTRVGIIGAGPCVLLLEVISIFVLFVALERESGFG